MDLLEFARGPALVFALAVFVLGSLWRLVGILMLPRMRDLSPAREGAASNLSAAWHANLRAMWPRKAFAPSTRFVTSCGQCRITLDMGALPPRRLRRRPPEGAAARGSKPTCVGLDGPRSGRVSRPCGLQGSPAWGGPARPSTHSGTSRPRACSSSWPTTLPTEDLAMRRSMFAAIVRPVG